MSRKIRAQLVFDFDRIVVVGQSESPRESADVGVDWQTWQIEHDAAYDISRLSSDTGKRDQIVEIVRNRTAEPLDHSSSHPDEIACFALIEARRANDLLHIGLVRLRK